MLSPDKILNKILEIRKDLKEDWEDELYNINVYEKFSPIYLKFYEDNFKANVMVCFIVLAYSKNSEWIHLHMDRMENKIEILTTLAGKRCMEDQDYVDIACGVMSPYNEVIEFYINYQKDMRWRDIVSYYDYHSKTSALLYQANDNASMSDVGRSLKQGSDLRLAADELVRLIEKENILIDSALKKEKRTPLSERRGEDFMSHEIYIRGLRDKEKEENGEEQIGGDFMNHYD